MIIQPSISKRGNNLSQQANKPTTNIVILTTQKTNNTIKFLMLTIALVLSFFTLNSYATLNQSVIKEMIVCDTVAANNNLRCANFTANDLKNRASSILNVQECDSGQFGIFCPDNHGNVATEVRYLVIDAESGISSYYSVTKTTSGVGLQISAIPLGNRESELVDSILDLEELYKQAPAELRFNIDQDGVVTNGLHQRIDLIYYRNLQKGTANSSLDDPTDVLGTLLSKCPSALAYKLSSTCSGALGSLIRDLNASNDSFLRRITDKLALASVQAQVFNISVSVNLNDKLESAFRFTDGSLLVLELDLGEYIGISPQYHKSITSNDDTLSEYIARMNSFNIDVSADGFSGGETQAILSGLGGECKARKSIVGYDNEYWVQITTWPDGTKTATVTRISSQPIVIFNFSCGF